MSDFVNLIQHLSCKICISYDGYIRLLGNTLKYSTPNTNQLRGWSVVTPLLIQFNAKLSKAKVEALASGLAEVSFNFKV